MPQKLVMALEIKEEHVESLSSMDHDLCVKNFVWSKEEWPAINYDEFADGDDIPIISLLGILDEKKKKSQDYEILCQAMVNASSNWGFFKLVDHGVDLKVIENVKLRWNELFDLPMEQKLKGARSASLPLGYCATNPDYGKNLPWAEILQLLQSPQHVVAFATKMFGDQHQPFRLQVLKTDHQWVGIRPIPNSFVINIGDTIEAWTNGRLKSIVHRAVVNKEKQRLSAAYFISPSSSAIIDCPPQLMDPNANPRKYIPFKWEDFKKELLVQKRVVGKTALNRFLISN
ncbi:hypothetical protein CMV_005236 [Castanea mollissima]|uniref:Uncharacterized protein n=1 Tax=Castanea mollissima TaxID=60419 RepID=A0A8J4RT35_9ROSI|nr:hypothetical protein CMV_005236 [Castanea mollissima]